MVSPGAIGNTFPEAGVRRVSVFPTSPPKMQTLIRLVVFLCVLSAVLVGVSYLLDGEYRVERSIEIEAPAEVVFAPIADLRQWASWTPWDDMDPEMTATFSEVSTGVGAWQRWDGPKVGRGELKITAVEAPTRLAYDLHFPDRGMHAKGELTLTPTPTGVRVAWVDAGRLGMNPVNRWFGLFLDRLVGADFEKGLEELEKLAEARAATAR